MQTAYVLFDHLPSNGWLIVLMLLSQSTFDIYDNWQVFSKPNSGSFFQPLLCSFDNYWSGANFTKGLKPRLSLKLKTLVLNFVNRMISLWS